MLRDCQVRMSKTERQLAEDALLALPVITLANFDQLPISGRRFVTPKVRLDNIESLELYPDLEPEKKLDLRGLIESIGTLLIPVTMEDFAV